MTVKDLMEILATYPSDSTVLIFTEDGHYMLEEIEPNIDNDCIVLYHE